MEEIYINKQGINVIIINFCLIEAEWLFGFIIINNTYLVDRPILRNSFTYSAIDGRLNNFLIHR